MIDETRLKRLRYRAWHRGFKEADLILGPFADRFGAALDDKEATALEALLDVPDDDLYAWMMGRSDAPDPYRGPMLDRLRQHVRTLSVPRGV